MQNQVVAALLLCASCSSSGGDEAGAPSRPTAPAPASTRAGETDPASAAPTIPAEVTARLGPEDAAELARTWESSGTRARLQRVGLTVSSPAVSRPAAELGAAAAFAVSRSGATSLSADVYYFRSAGELEAAAADAGGADVARNGAYLVLVRDATGDREAVARVVAAVAGEE
jgi:hypothetical protein